MNDDRITEDQRKIAEHLLHNVLYYGLQNKLDEFTSISFPEKSPNIHGTMTSNREYTNQNYLQLGIMGNPPLANTPNKTPSSHFSKFKYSENMPDTRFQSPSVV
jgi:hypothetical protein